MDIHKRREIELHGGLASEYEERYGTPFSKLFQTHWNEQIISYLPPGNRRTVLDCGCGTGILLADLAARYFDVHGLDISLDMISRTSVDSENLKGLVVGDAEVLPYGDNSFDAVVCRGSLHHLPNIKKALGEFGRVLKAKGILVLSEPCNDAMPVRLARCTMYKRSAKFLESDVAFLSPELEALVQNAGFSIQAKRRFGYLAYALAGFPDHIPLLRYVPFSMAITKALMVIDNMFTSIPLINRLGLHVIIQARRGG